MEEILNYYSLHTSNCEIRNAKLQHIVLKNGISYFIYEVLY